MPFLPSLDDRLNVITTHLHIPQLPCPSLPPLYSSGKTPTLVNSSSRSFQHLPCQQLISDITLNSQPTEVKWMLAASRALPPRFPGLSILPSFKRTIFYVPLSSKTSITFFSIINSQLPLSLPILLRKYKKTSTCSPHVCRLMSEPLYAFPPVAMDELFMLPPAAKVRGN